MTIDCTDTSSACRRHDWSGHAHGGPGNQVHSCHANMVEKGANTCTAVGTILHEMGHAHGFRMVSGHNDEPGSDYVRDNDSMYRMGSSAASHCPAAVTAGTVVNAAFAGTPRTALGGACNHNADCQSGNCGAGTCTCNDDLDCATGQTCFRPITGPNFCSTVNRALGAACTRGDQCASGKCEADDCVCARDSDCPGNQRCRDSMFNKNFCEPR